MEFFDQLQGREQPAALYIGARSRWMPSGRLSKNSSQNSPVDQEACEEDEGQEGGKPPFVPNGPPSEPPFPPPEEPLRTASSLPIGLPTPER